MKRSEVWGAKLAHSAPLPPPCDDELAARMAAALREFCDRVDADEIRSAQFKALLAEYEALS